MVSFKHPLACTVTKCAGGLVALKEVKGPVVGEIKKDHVVKVPAVRNVVPAEELDAELLFVRLHRLREEGAHEELKEGVAPPSNREVRC